MQQRASVFLIAVWIFSLVWSMEAVTSMAMTGLLVLAFLELKKANGWGIRKRPDLGINWLGFLNRKDYLAMTIPFFLVLVSALYSEDMDYTIERLRIKLPFLLLPFAFYSIPRFDKKTYYGLLYWFLIILTTAAIYTGWHYFQNFEAINILISQGQPVPTPVNHIRFSLMMVYCVVAGLFLWKDHFHLKYKWERLLIGGMTLFLFGMIHLLSVKSGLVALYLCMGYLIGWYVFTSRKYLMGICLLVFTISIPLAGYYTIPSLKAKIDYTFWDLSQFKNGGGQEYSDSQRLVSLQNGIRVGMTAPIIGVGAGDVKKEIEKVYRTATPHFKPHRPHNQFISIFAGTGIIGLLVFVYALTQIIVYKKRYRNPLFTTIMIILLFSFLVENTIENAVGVAFFTLATLMALRHD